MKMHEQYIPMYLYHKEFKDGISSSEGKPFFIALERGEGEIKTKKITIYKNDFNNLNLRYVERYIKTMLWCYGGYKFYLCGDDLLGEKIAKVYSPTGERAFDYEFMTKVYQHPLTFKTLSIKEMPKDCENTLKPKLDKTGRRIGFDAGGSDRKVSACVNGEVVFEKETVWNPKLQSNIEYHISGVLDSLDTAISYLNGSVDCIGVSTAGIIVDGEIRVSSLFRQVSETDVKEKGFRLYKNLAKRYGCNVNVANDGDVTALAGGLQTGKGRVLGTAMGTSLAGGYIGEHFDIKGYLNEFAFVPVDASLDAPKDEWSGDLGVGTSYHSQDAVIRLAIEGGLDMERGNTPAEKLKIIQKLANDSDTRALKIFEKLGQYFGYTILWFNEFYDIDTVMLLGRVLSGVGGDIILAQAKSILENCASKIQILLPDEMSRRLGQSYAATLL
ncbi:MAG: ROK family protein [Christensenellaceae bacterium]|jgi:predicted NBD/HSP70 family sugar kinase|nr:ROK family protein [Christensenellaceae bacterium]